MATPDTRIQSIVNNIKRDFVKYSFFQASSFYWTASTKMITLGPLKSLHDVYLLLHEIAHAELGHTDYLYDVDLVRNEVAAWEHAKKILAPRYNLTVDTNAAEDALDTYRLWLHHRSLCPTCAQTGIQQNKNTYNCINCRCSWRVNEARLCNLRRKVN